MRSFFNKYDIMPKLNLIEILKDPDVDRLLDPFGFEHYCGSCDNFYDPVNGYGDLYAS